MKQGEDEDVGRRCPKCKGATLWYDAMRRVWRCTVCGWHDERQRL